ncbi:MAG TPA: hypothetical protein VFE62_06655, partial [Gemmataceae bacterium]|nr:hypothetical protein [Gemmataceae bacterium]
MAVKSRNTFWHGLHLVTRLIGLTGVLAALVGWFIYGVLDQREIGMYVLIGSAGAVALSLLFEVPGIVRTAFSHRGLFGFNVLLQVGLALAIVVGANVYSFLNYKRFDLTRDQIFTLDDETKKQLQELQGETEIVVVQTYVSFGQRDETKQDKYDFAAQRKIVEKVKDLAEAFQELGPRFRVHILDIQDDNYDKKLADIRKNVSEDLSKAIDKAPENSVFFYSKEKNSIQRLSFSDIYLLDKRGSVEHKNLVLNYQGVGPFARKVFNIEEKTPRVATAIIHPVLGFHDKRQQRYTMAGAKKVLDAYGLKSTDIALRRTEDGSIGEPTILTYEESLYEEIEDDLADLAEEIDEFQKAYDEMVKVNKFWSESSMEVLNKKYGYFILPTGQQGRILRENIGKLKKSVGDVKIIDVDEDDRKAMTSQSKASAEQLKELLDDDREEQARLKDKKSKLPVENLAEKRRFTDIEAKAKAMLADIDLLIVPRLTAVDIPRGEVYSTRIHRLEKGQFNAVKEFLKQGKPVLFLLGPTIEPPERGPDFSGGGEVDSVESMLGELG